MKRGKQQGRGVHKPVDPENPLATNADDIIMGADAMPSSHTHVQIVQLLRATFNNVQNYTEPPDFIPTVDGANAVQPPSPAPLNTPFASFKEIALYHKLCLKQYYAFLLLGTVLLNYMLISMFGQDIVDAACDQSEPTAAQHQLPVSELHSIMQVIMHLLGTENGSNKIRQLVMFFGGEAGSGKTEVTKAITTLARLWGLSDVFHKTATTGAAASLIDGCTIHLLASLMSKLKNVEFIYGLNIELLLLDEVSMFQQRLNGFLTQTLQKLLNRPGKILGGISGTSPHFIILT